MEPVVAEALAVSVAPEAYPHVEWAVSVFPVRLPVLQSIMPVAVVVEVDTLLRRMASQVAPVEVE
jgi:hypothetical protein